MSNFIPTTTVDILRGVETDEYGDEVDTDTAAVEDVPAAIQERYRNVYGQSQDQDRSIRYAMCRVPQGTDVREDDRIRDRATSIVYAIQELHDNSSPVHPSDVVMRLSRIT